MNVVIIGGGIAGVSVATALARATARTDLRVTLVEPKDYVEVRWASIRALFDREMAKRALMPLSTGLQRYGTISHVRAKAVGLSATEVTLDNGKTLPFDACVVATGARAAFPPLASDTVSRDKRLRELAKEGKRLVTARSALIVGGGLIGAELAGDLAAYSGDAGACAKERGKQKAATGGDACSVTLVHSRNELAAPMSAKASGKLHARLAALDVEIVTGEHADLRDADGEDAEPKWVGRESGREYNCEVVADARGVVAHNGGELVRDGVAGAAGSVDEAGWISTDEFGRIEGGDGALFALGDCTAGAYKSGAVVLERKNAVAHNVGAVIEAKRAGKSAEEAVRRMKSVPAGMQVVAVTAGPRAGVVQTPMFTDVVMLPRLKNQTMFLSRAKGQLGI